MKPKIVGIGEALWDLFDSGRQLGGAPANFAYHAHALGAEAQIITRVGDDPLGREIVQRFTALGLPSRNVQVDEAAPTGTAGVTLASNGSAVFAIQENVAWDFLSETEDARAAVRHADAVCFGSLAQRRASSRATIQKIVSMAPAHAIRIFDINLRQNYYSTEVIDESLRLSNILKLNEEELRIVSQLFGLGSYPSGQIESLARKFDLDLIAVTLGARGSLIWSKGEFSEVASQPVVVTDTVGAGDSFAAALALGLLHEMDLDSLNVFANDVARFVCSQPGATPVLPLEFAKRLYAKT